MRYALKGSSGEMAVNSSLERGIRAALAGIMAPLSEDKMPNLKDIASAAKPELNNTVWYVGVFGLASGWGLRTDLIPANLACNGSWRWFLDPRLKGKFTVHDPTWTDQMSWATAVCDADDHNYDPALKFFKHFAPNVKLVFSADAEATNGLSSGEIWGAYEYATVVY